MQIYRCSIEVDLKSPPACLVNHYLSWEHLAMIRFYCIFRPGWTMISAAAETSRLSAVSLPRFCQQAAAKHRHGTTLSDSELGVQPRPGRLRRIGNNHQSVPGNRQRGLEACCAHQVHPLHPDPNDLLHTEQCQFGMRLQLCSLPGAGPAIGRALMPLHSAGAEPESGTTRPLQ